MKRRPVCHLDELPDGAMKRVELEGGALVLIREGQRVFALRDVCPHQGARLSAGVLTSRRLSAAAGDCRVEKARDIVRCPWHNWEFDAASGRCLHDPERLRVATYRAEIENGHVVVTR